MFKKIFKYKIVISFTHKQQKTQPRDHLLIQATLHQDRLHPGLVDGGERLEPSEGLTFLIENNSGKY